MSPPDPDRPSPGLTPEATEAVHAIVELERLLEMGWSVTFREHIFVFRSPPGPSESDYYATRLYELPTAVLTALENTDER